MPLDALQDIVCVFGQPVAGNPTQFMIERAFEKAGLDWRYLSLEVPAEMLADAMRGMRAMGFRGCNLTIPHKVAVLEHLDRLSPAAEMMGAVNCVIREGDQLVGENTDGKGFLESLRPMIDPAGTHVVILGAGGAARAIAVELALAGVAGMSIVNRTPQRGQTLASLITEKTGVAATYVPWSGDFPVPAEADILINATSIGLNDPEARVPVDWEHAKPELVVADVVFNPPDTWFLHEARDRGLRTLDGLGMIVNQGAIGFKLWTGVEPDRVIMRDAVEEYMSL